MRLQSLYAKKLKFVAREVGSELILVPLTNNVAKMNEIFTLNETGKFIWENIQENTTVEELEKAMMAVFDIDESRASKDIALFLEKLDNMFA